MIAPHFPKHFLCIVCIASVCKALCGVAAGATGAVILQHFGREDNIADVASKNNAQHTMVSLFGLLMSVKFAYVINSSKHTMWITYSILTLIHMVSNYKMMSYLAFSTLNARRLKILLDRFLDFYGCISLRDLDDINTTEIIRDQFSPISIASNDLLWLKEIPNLKLYSSLFDMCSMEEIKSISQKGYDYFMVKRGSDVFVAIKKDLPKEIEYKAIFQAYILTKLPSSASVDESRVITEKYFPTFFKILQENHWKLSNLSPVNGRFFEFS